MASLDLFEQDRLLESLPAKIVYLRERLREIAALPHVGETRQAGMVGGIELVRTEYAGAVSMGRAGWGTGVPGSTQARTVLRPLGNVIVVFPPLSISLRELEILMDGIGASILATTSSE